MYCSIHVPWSIILDIVLLNLLDVVIRLRPVHSLGVLPYKITQQAHDGQDDGLKPKDGAGVQSRNHAKVLHGKVDLGCHNTVGGDEDVPNSHAAGDGKYVVFGPVVGNKRRLAQHRQENSAIERGSPDPVTSNLAVSLNQIPIPEELGPNIEDDGVVEGVGDPLCKRLQLEKVIALAHDVQLGISIQEACRDELVEDTQSQRGEDGVEDVVERERPRLVNDLPREDVLKGKLDIS